MQIINETIYASLENKHFFHYIMSTSDLPKLRTELTKIRHIFRKYSKYYKKFSKVFNNKSWSKNFHRKKNLVIFDAENDFESHNFAIFEEVFQNFGRSDMI